MSGAVERGDAPVLLEIAPPLAEIALNDPERRNALGLAMMDALDAALRTIAARDDVVVLLLRGEGAAFSAGFDLGAVVADPPLLETLVLRLSDLCRALRRMPQVAIAAVQDAAIAGGCALISACDLVIVAPDARIGYPVHRLGISPAVSAPTLQQAIGAGAARHMQLGGQLIDGREAVRLGLAARLAGSAESVLDEARRAAQAIAAHGPTALRATKAWLNELDGSLDDARFDGVARSTGRAATGDEARRLVAEFWTKRG